MAERDKRLTCWQCKSYVRELRRCSIGKTNPTKKHVSITVAEIFGPQALCMHNPFREPLFLRMHQPKRRFVWATPITVIFRDHLDVEIIEE